MSSRSSLRALASLSIVLAAGSAVQAGVITFSSDAAFSAYESSGGFTKSFGGNVRWGSGVANGDWEYAIVDANDIPIGAVGQTAWAGTNTHNVVFAHAPGLAALDLSLIGTIARNVPSGATSLFVRVRDSETPFSQLATINVDLDFNGPGFDYSYNALVGDANAEYWGIEDPNLAAGFTVYAVATLDGPRTSGSDPMYQFKVGVPAPGAAGLLALGGLVIARRRR